MCKIQSFEKRPKKEKGHELDSPMALNTAPEVGSTTPASSRPRELVKIKKA
jgi:hypothetical protein